MPTLIDLIGKRIGRLIVTAYAQDRKWSCVCDCGARVVVNGQCLRQGRSQSCGCLKDALAEFPEHKTRDVGDAGI